MMLDQDADGKWYWDDHNGNYSQLFDTEQQAVDAMNGKTLTWTTVDEQGYVVPSEPREID